MNSHSFASQISFSPRRYSRRETLMPPSPWIGSMNTATTFLLRSATWRTACEVVERHAHEALHQRLEARLHLAAAGRRQRGERAAVEGLLHDDDRRLGDAAVVAVLARDLDRRLVGFQPGVAEEHLVQAGDLGDAVGGLLLQRDLEQVGAVDDAADLLGERVHQARMIVAERVHGDAGERVQVLLARLVVQPDALAAHERHRLPGVGVHHVAHGVNLHNAKRRPKPP